MPCGSTAAPVRPSGSQSTCVRCRTIATQALARFQPSGAGSYGSPLAVRSCSHGPGPAICALRRSMSPNFCIARRASVAASTASFHAMQSGPPSGRSRYCFGISLNMPTSTDRACSSRPVTRSASCLGRPAIVRLPWVRARCRLDCITAARKIAENRRLAHARGQRFHERSLADRLGVVVLRPASKHSLRRSRWRHISTCGGMAALNFRTFQIKNNGDADKYSNVAGR